MLDKYLMIKSNSMTGKFFLRKDKDPNEFGEFCVYIRYSTMGVGVKKSMNIWVKPEHWLESGNQDNKYIKCGKSGHPKGQILNQRLINIKKGYDQIIEELLSTPNSVITVPVLQSILNGTYKEKQEINRGKVSFIDYVLKVNEDLYNLGKISYSVWRNIQCNMNRFRKYLQQVKGMETNGNNILYCRDLTVKIIKDYIDWRKSEGNTNDTINKSLTPIFKAVKKLMRLEWIDKCEGEEILELYLPPNVKPLGENDSDIQYLTECQVKKLIEISGNVNNQRTKEYIEMYLFSIHCGGLRFSDICSLKWSEIDWDNRIINHIQYKNHTQKTTRLTLPITKEGMKILKKWEGRYDTFVFGLLPDDFDITNQKLFLKMKATKNKCINQSLRSLGKKMGLEYNLKFHSSRHTFGTISLNKGVDINVISNLMGHSSTWVTQKVYSKYLPETLSGIANEKLNFEFN